MAHWSFLACRHFWASLLVLISMAILPPRSDGVHAAPIRNDPAWIAAGQQAEAVARADGWSVKGLTYNRRVPYLVEVEADYSTHYVLIHQRRVLSGGGITALANYLHSSGVWNEPKLQSEDMRKLVEVFNALPPFDRLGSVRPNDYQGAFSDTPPRLALVPQLKWRNNALIYTLTYIYLPDFPPPAFNLALLSTRTGATSSDGLSLCRKQANHSGLG